MRRQNSRRPAQARLVCSLANRPGESALEPAPPPTRIVVDAHVHVHACFDRARFFDHAARNLARATRPGGAAHEPARARAGVLMLAEGAGETFFADARRAAAAGDAIGRWRVQLADEPESLVLEAGDESLFVVAGRQIACAEGLEVLALATTACLDDGRPIREVLRFARESNALPVVPWGAGKWLFGRGRLLVALLHEAKHDAFFLGDESARPVGWSRPRHFALADSLGIRNLPGTDPLPFASEEDRAGRYGFLLDLAFDPRRPAATLRGALRDPSTAPRPFGARETPLRFLRNQIAMQRRKRLRRDAP